MKACVYHQYGSPEVLQIEELPVPKPKAGEVLVRVRASSVNSWDWDMLSGRPLLYRLLHGLFKPKFPIMGADVAGVVEEIGAGVQSFAVGDEVFGDISEIWGGFAQCVCVPESRLVKKPQSMSFEHAAAIPHSAVMAYQMLIDVRPVEAGDSVLINAAGGCVGTFAVQMAKHMGATVTCVDSAEKLDMLQALGADFVIDYRSEDFTKNGKTYDRIIDMVSMRHACQYRRSLTKNGISLILGGKISKILSNAIVGPLISTWSSKHSGMTMLKQNANLDKIIRLYEFGIIKPVIDQVYQLEDVPVAMHRIGAGKSVGKMVIAID